MGAGHAHPLYLPGRSPVHRLPAEVKIVAAVLGAICVVATPREAFGVFAGHLVVLAVVWAVARIPPGWILRRAVIELPFVVLAVLLPVHRARPADRRARGSPCPNPACSAPGTSWSRARSAC